MKTLKQLYMNMPVPSTHNFRTLFFNACGWFFGILTTLAGLVNTFWGNDPGFGIFLLTLAFVYFPPAVRLVKEKTGLSLHPILKILLAAFIIIAVLGVGELFDKVDMMLLDLTVR